MTYLGDRGYLFGSPTLQSSLNIILTVGKEASSVGGAILLYDFIIRHPPPGFHPS